MSALPSAVPATDSAAAPRRPLDTAKRARSAPLRPDPDYERRLEELARDMLGSAAVDPAAAAPLADASAGSATAGSATARSATHTGAARRAAGTAPDDTPPASARHQAASERSALAADDPESASLAASAREPATVAASARPRNAPSSQPARRTLPEADSHGRREPVLEPFESADAFHAVRQRHARRRSRMIAGTLVAGVALGLGSAWWFGKLDQMESAMAAVNAQAGRLVASMDRKPHSDSSGASESAELQSGSEPVQAAQEASPGPSSSAPSAASTAQSPSRSIRPAPAVPDGVPTPTVVTPAPARVTQAAPQTPAQAEPESVSKPAVASVDARRKKDKAKEKSASRPRGEKHKAPQVAAARPSKKASPGNAEKHDDDLDRLRSQAYGESSRDREHRVLPAPKAPSPQSSVAVTPISTGGVSYKKELAQCEKIDGLFYQERCKWRICKDKWGSNGCPSFPQQSVRF